MKPIIYEIRRAFTSKTAIILMILIILLSVGVGYGLKSTLASENPTPSEQANFNFVIYYSNDSYEMVFNFYNGYGLPASGILVNITFPHYGIASAKKTDSYGYANFSFPGLSNTVPIGMNAQFKYPPEYPGGHAVGITTTLEASVHQVGAPPGTYQISAVVNPYNPTQRELHIFYVGLNDTRSPQVHVYDMGFNATQANDLYRTSEGSMNSSGTIGDFYTTNLNLNLPNNSNFTNYYVAFTKSTPDKNQTAFNATFQGQLVYPLSSAGKNRLFFSEISGAFSILVPLMAVLLSYLTYGRERATGIIESVVARPVTKTQVMGSRYLATIISIMISIAISISVLDVFVYYYFGESLSGISLIMSFWGLLVETSAFVGIMYILSNVFKGPAKILGTGILLYFALVIGWSFIEIVLLFNGLHAATGTTNYLQFQSLMDFINPGNYIDLAQSLAVGSAAAIDQGLPTFGVDAINVLAAGVLWIVVPFVLALFLNRARD